MFPPTHYDDKVPPFYMGLKVPWNIYRVFLCCAVRCSVVRCSAVSGGDISEDPRWEMRGRAGGTNERRPAVRGDSPATGDSQSVSECESWEMEHIHLYEEPEFDAETQERLDSQVDKLLKGYDWTLAPLANKYVTYSIFMIMTYVKLWTDFKRFPGFSLIQYRRILLVNSTYIINNNQNLA